MALLMETGSAAGNGWVEEQERIVARMKTKPIIIFIQIFIFCAAINAPAVFVKHKTDSSLLWVLLHLCATVPVLCGLRHSACHHSSLLPLLCLHQCLIFASHPLSLPSLHEHPSLQYVTALSKHLPPGGGL